MIHYKPNYSTNILLQMLLAFVLLAIVVFWNHEAIVLFYFLNQETQVGVIINGFILVLFLFGLSSIIRLLFHYRLQEQSLNLFLINLRQSPNNPALSAHTNSIIVRRYESMVDLHKQKSAINQGALAATVVASESTRLSLPRHISNVLILCGVFGTIVSLAIALLGASSLLESSGDISGMGSVIHGMSTALSTTTTAIVSYLFFGYFYQKLTDVQTQLFSAIEQTTTINLMPRFSHQNENIMHHLGDLVTSLNHTANNMQIAQQNMIETSSKANAMISKYDARVQGMADNMDEIKNLLREGFRLPNTTAKNKVLQAQKDDTREATLLKQKQASAQISAKLSSMK